MKIVTEKWCSKCREVKPIEEFCKNKTSSDGHHWECGVCHRARRKAMSQVYRERREERAKPENIEKRCSKCKLVKNGLEFRVCNTSARGLRPRCRQCELIESQSDSLRARKNLAYKKWKENNPEAFKLKARKAHLKHKFGLTIEEFDAMVIAQGGRCAICGRDHPLRNGILAIDHDHTTGKVRALLCDLCNKGIGHFKEDVEVMAAAIRYLKAHAD